MLKTYKFRVYPNETQKIQLNIEFNNARFVWNHALSMRKKAYQRRGENLNYISLTKHVGQLKQQSKFIWLKQSTTSCLTQKIKDLDKAYSNFFHKRAERPKFKKKSHDQSVRYRGAASN